MKLIGVFPSAGLDQSRVEVFLQAMQQLGWSDNRNVRLDIRWARAIPKPTANGRRKWSRSRPR